MKWSVDQLKRWRGQPFIIDETVNVTGLKERDPEIRDVSPVHVQGEATVREDFATFHLHLSGQMVLPCSLTLEDVDYPFSIDTIETFQFETQHIDWEIDDNEEVHQVENNVVDLLPAVKENILLAVPIKVEGKQAAIKPSGEGWQVVSEDSKKKQVDPRMAKLATLLEKNKQNETDKK